MVTLRVTIKREALACKGEAFDCPPSGDHSFLLGNNQKLRPFFDLVAMRSLAAHTALLFYYVKPQAYAFKIFDFNSEYIDCNPSGYRDKIKRSNFISFCIF